jgi:hypothetical protein
MIACSPSTGFCDSNDLLTTKRGDIRWRKSLLLARLQLEVREFAFQVCQAVLSQPSLIAYKALLSGMR